MRTVAPDTGEIQLIELLAVSGVVVVTTVAMPAGSKRQNHVVSNLNLGDIAADGHYGTAAFMPENRRQWYWKDAIAYSEVRVAHAHATDPNENFVIARIVDVERFHGELLSLTARNSCFNFHIVDFEVRVDSTDGGAQRRRFPS
ncbi:hypothetical protein BURK_008276 [Burkholderia sp. SJ98]|nr:hypothetical protein BURK_008276 [Burkholderia sp. SJ98]